ncbi:MAG: hypothetical protein ACR2L3_02585, partial [Actinomycetota bacterium]
LGQRYGGFNMSVSRSFRGIAVVASASMVLGAFVAAPAEAKKKKSCPAFQAVEPVSDSGETAEALEAEVVKVTDKATADKPIVIEYEHGPALWDTATQTPIVEDTTFFNFQVQSKKPAPGLHLEMTWPTPSESDIDMYLYDAAGARVASSGASNLAPVPGVLDAGGNGGMGFETIPGNPAVNCAGYTVESRAFMTTGQMMTLTVYLGEVGDNVQP